MLHRIPALKNKKENLVFFLEKSQIAMMIIFAFLVGVISWFGMQSGGLDMRDDILPSLINWLAPWKEGTPLFPWAVIMLMPFRFFTPRMATAVMNAVSVILLSMIIRRYKGNMLLSIPLLFSPMGYGLIFNGQTDVLVLAGLLLPPGMDLLLFWKPQVTLHAFWNRARRSLKVYLVSGGILMIVSFLVWGFWPKEIYLFGRDNLLSGWWNKSLWPYSIPVGALLVYYSIKKRDEMYGVMASPLLFPYVNAPSYIGMVAMIACKWPRVFWGCFFVYWIYVLIVLIFPWIDLPIL